MTDFADDLHSAPQGVKIVPDPLAPSRHKVRGKKARSRVSNGNTLIPGIDQRSCWVRRARDIIEMHVSDLGGESNTSTAERSLIRRIAVLTTQLEMLESKFAKADGDASPKNLDLYVRGCGSLRRLLQTIGLQRRPRDVTPPRLADYLREKRMAGADVAEEVE